MKKSLLTLALSLGVFAAPAFAQQEYAKNNYLVDSSGQVVKSGTGLCWHTGSWTPANAVYPCDGEAPKVIIPVIEEQKKEPRRVITQHHESFSTNVLFDFDKYQLTAVAKSQIDELLMHLKKGQLVEIQVVGHTDRIGTEDYNMTLSQRRALAVREYLIGRGVERLRIRMDAKGESMPVVECNQKSQKDLIKCLAPNRRADVTLKIVEQKVRYER